MNDFGSNIGISYCIPVCNEHWELELLLNHLQPHIQPNDEVLVQGDLGNVTDEVKSVVERFGWVKYSEFPLNRDFATFKNKLIGGASKDYIMLIDADELPSTQLLYALKPLLAENLSVDMMRVPRFNVVVGLTEEWKRTWGWRTVIRTVNDSVKGLLGHYGLDCGELELVNLPDHQSRIFRNSPEIKWTGKVHEQLVGIKKYAILPHDGFNFGFFHIKQIDRQIKQNNLYNTL